MPGERVAALQHTPDRLRVELAGVDETFANMLRRALTDVPIAAAERVTFRINTSAFGSDVLAHRLGLVALRARAPHPTRATLSARGPAIVRASDIVSDDVEVASPFTLIVVLSPGEELDAVLHIGTDTGKRHARYNASVASRCVRRHRAADQPPLLSCAAPWTDLPRECFCQEVAWGSTCEECGGAKRIRALRDAPLSFVLEFETTGALPALELLRRSWEAALATVDDVAARLGPNEGESMSHGYEEVA